MWHKDSYKRTKRLLIFAAIISIVLIVASFLRSVIMPVIYSTSEAKVKALASNAVNNAADKVLSGTIDYSEFFEVVRDESDEILLIKTYPIKINLLTRMLVTEIQSEIDASDSEELIIPTGNFTGINVFIGKGKNIKITINPIGSADGDYFSEFYYQGVNQTIHRLYFTICAEYTVALPYKTQNIFYKTNILILENIIVGRVPQSYINVNSLDSAINLIP